MDFHLNSAFALRMINTEVTLWDQIGRKGTFSQLSPQLEKSEFEM